MRHALLAFSLCVAGCGELYTDPARLPLPVIDAAVPVVCGPSNCAGCCFNNTCRPSNSGTCGLGGAQCVTCTPGTSCAAGRCAPDPWTIEGSGYDCRVPRAVTLTGSRFEEEIDLVSDSVGRNACGVVGNTRAWRAYELATEVTGVVDIEAVPVTPGSRSLGLEAYERCNGGSPLLVSACASAVSYDPARLTIGAETLRALHGFSVFERDATGVGKVRVSVTAHAATCADPAPLRLTTVHQVTAGEVDQASGSCGGAGRGDRVFRIDTQVAGNLRIDVKALGSPVLYLRSACDQGELACAPGPRLDALDLQPGTYFVWVDNVAPGLSFDVAASLLPLVEAGDVCAAPRTLSFSPRSDGSRVATDLLDPKSYGRNGDVSCQFSPGPDVVYELETDGGEDLFVSAPLANAFSLRQGSCAAAELVCKTAPSISSENYFEGGLPPGRHLLSVAVYQDNALSLNATLRPSLPADNCGAPRPLVFSSGPDGGSVEVTGDTRGTHDDASGSCSASYFGSKDQVHTFTTTEVLDLRAVVTGSSFLYLRSSCRSGELGCGYSGLTTGSLLPGTYYLWVDGTSPGPYTLTANLTRPVPGDTCLNPRTLLLSADDAGVALGVNVTGDTYRLFSDFQGSCGGSTSPDLVYRLDTVAPLNLRAVVSPTWSSYQPTVYLRGASCDGGVEVACAAAPSPGTDATLMAPNLPAGTWYLFVDGLGGTSGPFSLSVTAQ